MNIADWHNEEDMAREEIKRRNPNHPVLKRYFGSTYEAVEEYWKVLRELDQKKEEECQKKKNKTF